MDRNIKRGFAAISVDQRREISRLGGQAIPRAKRAFSRDPKLASEAGKKGGQRRREANDKDAKLLTQSLEAPVIIEFGASGRTLRKVSRLLRLGYWTEVAPVKADQSHRYAITDAGRDFLMKRDEDLLG